MHYQTNMTVNGQVTVPKDIRNALGLQPAQPVKFELEANGNARILKANTVAETERRKAGFRDRLKEAQAIFKANDAFPGMTTDEYMEMVRGPNQP